MIALMHECTKGIKGTKGTKDSACMSNLYMKSVNFFFTFSSSIQYTMSQSTATSSAAVKSSIAIKLSKRSAVWDHFTDKGSKANCNHCGYVAFPIIYWLLYWLLYWFDFSRLKKRRRNAVKIDRKKQSHPICIQAYKHTSIRAYEHTSIRAYE